MTPDRPVTIFVSIGNVQDRLVQRVWAEFHREASAEMELAGGIFHGEWHSPPTAMWQTAVWCIDIQPGIADRLKGKLAQVGAKYGQGMVGWNEISSSVLLG